MMTCIYKCCAQRGRSWQTLAHAEPGAEPRMVESTAEADFTLTLKVLSGITCLLSILGAGLIIATYIAFGDLRTVARQLLVNLSLADITVAASHFVGLAALRVENYETPYNSDGSGEGVGNYSTEQDTLCKVQGGFTMFGTLASFLWTLALGFYMLMVIVLKRTDVTRYLVFLYYPVCWGVPLTLTLWFGLVKPTYLGFGEGADIGIIAIRGSSAPTFCMSADSYLREDSLVPVPILSLSFSYRVVLY